MEKNLTAVLQVPLAPWRGIIGPDITGRSVGSAARETPAPELLDQFIGTLEDTKRTNWLCSSGSCLDWGCGERNIWSLDASCQGMFAYQYRYHLVLGSKYFKLCGPQKDPVSPVQLCAYRAKAAMGNV